MNEKRYKTVLRKLWNISIPIKLSDLQQTNDHMPLLPPILLTNATGTYLDHLADDCLLEIFSKSSLTPMDLCSLAETCKLFKRLAPRVFPKRLRIERNDSTYFVESKNVQRRMEGAHDVERIFQHFGSCLIALSVCRFDAHEMNLVGKHCVAGTLKELKFENVKFTESCAIDLQPILQQLQLLAIVNPTIDCDANVFADCGSLTELQLWSVARLDEILEIIFPELQRFSFFNTDNDLDFGPLLLNFAARHHTLKHLDVITSSFKEMDVFVRELGNICNGLRALKIFSGGTNSSTLDLSNFQNLERLSLFRDFDAATSTTLRLHQLKSLKALTIGGTVDHKEVLDALPLLKNLRELDLCVDSMPDNIQWTSLSHLTKLNLSGDYSIVDIIRQLTNLQELEICSVLSEKEFHEIAKLVNERPTVLTLKCQFEFSLSNESYLKMCGGNAKVKLIKSE